MAEKSDHSARGEHASGQSLAADKLSAFYRHPDDCDKHGQPIGVRKDKVTRLNPRLTRPMKFASLHHHSTYSYLDGFQLPAAHARRAAELNMSAIAMTEHGNVSSHSKLEKACTQEKDAFGDPNPAFGIKPIFGCELYCGYIDEERRSQTKNHLTVLAKDLTGYRNLMQLVTKSYSEGFYHKGTVDGHMLKGHREGLVVLSGCNSSLLFTSLIGGKAIPPEAAGYARGRAVAHKFKKIFDGNYFLEVQGFPQLEGHRIANGMIARISRELKIPMVASMDCHYTVPTESEIQKILHNARGAGKQTIEDLERNWGYDVHLCPPLTDKSLMKSLIATGLTKDEAIRAILTSEEIAQECTVTLPKLPTLRYPAEKRTAAEIAWDWIEIGWKYRGCDRMSSDEQKRYRERAEYEMGIITEKDFVDYFLVVSDAVRWAKDTGICVGPARGSAAASLVCWLLRITEVNPLLFDHLVFERFIDISRSDWPDIDLDFESSRRNEVIEYLVSKYGRECVSNVGTFTMYKAKNSLIDVARAHRIPDAALNKLKSVLIERSSGDLRASATIEDTVEQFDEAREAVEEWPELWAATQLEGNVRGFSTHAAGVVVSNGPITEVCAVIERKTDEEVRRVVGVDKYDAEYLNLMKLDFLALTTLDILADCCRELGVPIQFLYDLPIVDEKTIQGFKDNDVNGIFQYDGRAVRSVNGALKPDTFQEVCDITALARPGPLHNGAANEYIDIKRGVKKSNLAHPAIEEIARSTHYQIVYQEQILRIVREIGDFDWTHAGQIRRIISKKLGEQEFNRQWERFLAGALTVHERRDVPPMNEQMAQAIWGMCITAGSYAFNAAHSVAYGFISWWCQWFKQHHPDIFFLCTLWHTGHSETSGGHRNRKASAAAVAAAQLSPRTVVLQDAAHHGFKILPPSIKRSEVTWKRLPHKRLRAGFDEILGVGPATANAIINYRNDHGLATWDELINVKGIGPSTMEKIKDFATKEDPFNIYSLGILLDKMRKEVVELGLPEPNKTAAEITYERGRDEEMIWIGIALARNLRDIFESNRAKTGVELKREEVKQPELNEWMMIAGYDGTEIVTLRINRFKYPQFRKAVWGMKMSEDILLVRGVKPGWRTAREIYVHDLWIIDPEG